MQSTFSTETSTITANTSTSTSASQAPAEPSVSDPVPSISQSFPMENLTHAGNPSKSKQKTTIEERVEEILAALEKKEKIIIRQLSLSESIAVSPKTDWIEEDPCVVDVQLASKSSVYADKFRGGLGRCLLADRYLSWEKRKYGTSRVEILSADLCSSDRRHHVQEYVDTNSTLKNKETARKAIGHGIKYRVFERVYGNPGVSSFLIFVYHLFRELPYPGFEVLAGKVRQSERWCVLANKKSGWMNKCQQLYKGECLIDSFGSECSNTPLERNHKSSLPKKRAGEEETSSEKQRKQQRTEGTSHARPSDFQPQTECAGDPTENTDFTTFDPSNHQDEAFTSIDQGIPRHPSAEPEDSYPVDCIDHVLASTEFVMHFCPDQHIGNILTGPQYD